jgi:Na+-transporting methylmalonyl-CoA/oxaloacetate decarboxylase gamma subunit
MFYVIVFAVLAVLLVVVVLVGRGARERPVDQAPHHQAGAEGASHTPSGSRQRQERKRRRAQSRKDRRKRH